MVLYCKLLLLVWFKELLDWFIMGFILNNFCIYLFDVLCVCIGCINIGLCVWLICGNLFDWLLCFNVEYVFVEGDLESGERVDGSESFVSGLFELVFIIGYDFICDKFFWDCFGLGEFFDWKYFCEIIGLIRVFVGEFDRVCLLMFRGFDVCFLVGSGFEKLCWILCIFDCSDCLYIVLLFMFFWGINWEGNGDNFWVVVFLMFLFDLDFCILIVSKVKIIFIRVNKCFIN